jgi:hypothetical protein
MEFVAEFPDAFHLLPTGGYSRKNWVYKGYCLFQYDLQFVRVDPDFFFERQWYRFDACLERLMRELRGTCDP